MIALDARLLCIYEAVGCCDCLVDIGSDHALLPISVLQTGHAKRSIACDINAGPLERSRKNALKYGISNIGFYLSNGFDALMECTFDKAAICGMGGVLIADIIKRGGEKAHCGLIVQPMTSFEELRAFLWDNGFFIDNETFAVEADKPYVVINTHYTGKKENYSYSDLFLGKIRPDTHAYRLFCRKIAIRAEKKLTGILHNGLPAQEIKKLIYDCNTMID